MNISVCTKDWRSKRSNYIGHPPPHSPLPGQWREEIFTRNSSSGLKKECLFIIELNLYLFIFCSRFPNTHQFPTCLGFIHPGGIFNNEISTRELKPKWKKKKRKKQILPLLFAFFLVAAIPLRFWNRTSALNVTSITFKLRIYAGLKFMKYFSMKESLFPSGKLSNKSQHCGFTALEPARDRIFFFWSK